MNREFSRLVFDYGFDEQEEYEANLRGYRSHVWIELTDGSRYPVTFFNITRLSQELELEIKVGRPFFTETGLIILPDVTLANMEIASKKLVEEGFFK